MIRRQYHITERQEERLKSLSQRTGLSDAEHIRRALDAYLEQEEAKLREEKRNDSDDRVV